jgi:very-short-patch-repair endonuclease
VRTEFEEVEKYLKLYNTIILTTKNNYKNISQRLTLVCQQCQQNYQCSFFDFKRKENKICISCAKKNIGLKKIISIEKKEIINNITDITILDEKESYGREEKISCQCATCQHVFYEKYHILLRKKSKGLVSCSHCNLENRGKRDRQKTYHKTVEFCQNNNLTFISSEQQFMDGEELFQCPKCQQSFHRPHKYFNRETYPNRTELCQNCSNSNPISSEEIKIRTILEKHNIIFEENNRTILSGKELDIYIPDRKIAIEINGLYYHSELKGMDKHYHLNKTLECEQQGIQLLHFWDYEVNNKLWIVEDIIKSKLNLLENQIGARELQIEMIDSSLAKQFMNMNHLHGFCQAKWHIGLKKDNMIYTVISLGRSRTSDHWEIIRFATLNNTKVIGGYSRLIAYIRKELRVERLMSFADRRISNGDLYLKSGWQLNGVSNPCYWYFKNKQIHHRSNFMKHKLKKYPEFDQNLTEWQMMIKMGYDRVWDCGNLKFVY